MPNAGCRMPGITNGPITPEVRLAVCLYRLGRGDYLHTISELTGLGTSTVCEIVVNVCKTIVNRLWDSCVAKHMPNDLVKIKESMVSFPLGGVHQEFSMKQPPFSKC